MTFLPHWPELLFVTMLVGQEIEQLCVTVTVKEQLPELPAVSLAEQLTVVVPSEKLEPDGGVQVTVRAPSQMSLAVTENVAVAEPEPGELSVTLIGEGQATTGP